MTRSTSWPLEPAWLVGPVERAAHTNQRGAHSGLGVGQYQGSTQAPQCGAHMYTTFHTSTRAHRGLPPGPRSAGSVHGPCSITLPISVNQNVAKKLLLATHMVDLADFSPDTTPVGPFFSFALLGHEDPNEGCCGCMWAHMRAVYLMQPILAHYVIVSRQHGLWFEAFPSHSPLTLLKKLVLNHHEENSRFFCLFVFFKENSS